VKVILHELLIFSFEKMPKHSFHAVSDQEDEGRTLKNKPQLVLKSLSFYQDKIIKKISKN
jgi:hypothetical protein